MYSTFQFFLALFCGLIIGAILGSLIAYAKGYRKALRHYSESERKQMRERKMRDTETNIANRFANELYRIFPSPQWMVQTRGMSEDGTLEVVLAYYRDDFSVLSVGINTKDDSCPITLVLRGDSGVHPYSADEKGIRQALNDLYHHACLLRHQKEREG